MEHRYKIGYVSIRHATRATKMTTYYSRWLEEAGFGTETPVTVGVKCGQLVIRALAE